MDDSIEFIGEVTNGNKNMNSSDLELLYDGSSSFRTETPKLKRPSRKRCIKPRLDEQHEVKKILKTLRSPRKPRLRPILKLSATNSPSVPSLAKPKAVKRKSSSFSGHPAVKKVKKTPRSEAAGAGTLKRRKKIIDDDIQIVFEWDPANVIAERQKVQEWQARNILNLFDQENTLPFIARYRKEKTGNLEVEKLREIQNAYSQLKLVKEKVSKLVKNDEVTAKLKEDQKDALLRATTVHEVDHLSSFLKSRGKGSHADRARELGLESYGLAIIDGHSKYTCKQALYSLVNSTKEGLRTVDEIEQGLQYIIADVINRDAKVLEFIQNLERNSNPMLESYQKKQLNKEKGKVIKKTTVPNENLCSKYKLYFNFKMAAWNTKPHQILALNRGENQNVLSVKVAIPHSAYIQYFNFCHRKWIQVHPNHYYRTQLIEASIEDAWKRLIEARMERHIRTQLTEMAEIASVEVFTSNLKKLLLTPPFRGKTVLAIDPGFQNGCKIGVTDIRGEVILTTTIYPFRGKNHNTTLDGDWSNDHNAVTLREIVEKHRCEYFTIGNGTACREMEAYLSSLIRSGCFQPFNVQYTIINESGASQYSVSEEALSEFPNMDPNHISAVSLARRLQEPLLEYVKVHPKHLGVGMYQHDIPERILNASLESVMTECVSFVGVDINVASEFVLRKLSGLTKIRAASIIEYRKTKGPFMNRKQLMDVKNIGPKTFEQCAGFIRIMPETVEQEIQRTPVLKKVLKDNSFCPFDRTMIHPESYDYAYKFLKIVGIRPQDIGSETFIKKVCDFMRKSSLEAVAKQCGTTFHTLQLIVEGLSQPLDFDIRAQFEKPLFRRGVKSLEDLEVGTKLTGTIRNVTHFGSFVDVGVGTDGLIHSSNTCGMKVSLGSTVEVCVMDVQMRGDKARINLRLEKVIG